MEDFDELRRFMLKATTTNTTNSTIDTSKAGIYKMTTLGGIMGFMRGFLNGTRTITTNNMTVCENLVVTQWD